MTMPPSQPSAAPPFTIDTQQWFRRPIDEVFAFFADAFNLEQITPPWLHFHVLTPAPIAMQPGTLIDYKLRLHGIPIRWRSEITAWQPPFFFIDEQRKGPYRLWHHEHRFEPRDGGTLVTDHVDYRVIGGRLVNRFFVRRDLDRIFAFRHAAMEKLLS